jgi:hypothetical protein
MVEGTEIVLAMRIVVFGEAIEVPYLAQDVVLVGGRARGDARCHYDSARDGAAKRGNAEICAEDVVDGRNFLRTDSVIVDHVISFRVNDFRSTKNSSRTKPSPKILFVSGGSARSAEAGNERISEQDAAPWTAGTMAGS